MPVQVVTEVDTKPLDELSSLLADMPEAMRRAEVRAINKTLRAGRKNLAGQVKRQMKRVSVRRLKYAIDVKKANRSMPYGTMKISGRRLPLKAFRPTQTARGVKVQTLANRPPIVLADSFVMGNITRVAGFKAKGAKVSRRRIKVTKVKSSARGMGHVFTRRTRKRLPIDKRFGPSIIDALEVENATNIQGVVKRELADVYQKRLAEEVNYEVLKKLGKVAASDREQFLIDEELI